MPVIAIAREIGAGGVDVAKAVAQELGADLVDRRIIDEIATRLRIPDEAAQGLDEMPAGLFERLLAAMGRGSSNYEMAIGSREWTPPYVNDPAFDPRRASLRITEDVIKEAARSGNAVFVGRGAAFLLRDDPSVLRVFVHAPKSVRVETLRQTMQLDKKAAERRVAESDVNWGAYGKDTYHVDWRDPSNYDLMVDTSRLGIDLSAKIILTAARR